MLPHFVGLFHSFDLVAVQPSTIQTRSVLYGVLGPSRVTVFSHRGKLDFLAHHCLTLSEA